MSTQGEIVTLIGANGAGKSTLLMTICGTPAAARTARIVFEGEDITRLPTYEIIRLGIAQSPEGRRIFARMTVLENLQMGAIDRRSGSISTRISSASSRCFPILKKRQGQRGGTLSGGEQQMLAIGRALMSRPRLLLLDEPSLGLRRLIVKQIFEVIRDINETQGMTVFLVEQNAYPRAAARPSRLRHGQRQHHACRGTGRELLANPEVRAAYLEGGH